MKTILCFLIFGVMAALLYAEPPAKNNPITTQTINQSFPDSLKVYGNSTLRIDDHKINGNLTIETKDNKKENIY